MGFECRSAIRYLQCRRSRHTHSNHIPDSTFFHANIYSYVEHDCTIGDYVTFAPRVNCNGHVVIKDFAYLGAAAAIRQGKPGVPVVIGRDAVVGMGAIVLNGVAEEEVVAGNPARPLGRTKKGT
jgi:acyl-[acyl carrier protein]--UDP-N-acetylglucosamine O-acyltransferase